MWYRDTPCKWKGCQEPAVNNSKFCALHRNHVFMINKKRKTREKRESAKEALGQEA